jgi:hypothetical protein
MNELLVKRIAQGVTRHVLTFFSALLATHGFMVTEAAADEIAGAIGLVAALTWSIYAAKKSNDEKQAAEKAAGPPPPPPAPAEPIPPAPLADPAPPAEPIPTPPGLRH